MTLALRVHAAIDEIPAGDWDALHGSPNPFVQHAFLDGLERHGCVRRDWGWVAHHLSLWRDDALIAAAPAYLKANSHGEFVFDYAWASAYERYGRSYYPKLLVGVPYTPVSGPRLLARDDAARTLLLGAIEQYVEQAGLSSAHVNFLPEAENGICGSDWCARRDVQFHWTRRADWRQFDDFLGALQSKKRKNIRQERAQVLRTGVAFRVVQGDEIGDDDLAVMHALYCQTFFEKGNSPALTLTFLRHLAAALPRALVLILAEREGRTIAGALCLRGGDTLYGRYWGSFEALPGLHFETCYYQGIDYCLREGLDRFEPGAQGEHKVARGFLPVFTHSRHWLSDTDFRAAIEPWCEDERRALGRYWTSVLQHSPYRPENAVDGPADPAAGA